MRPTPLTRMPAAAAAAATLALVVSAPLVARAQSSGTTPPPSSSAAPAAPPAAPATAPTAAPSSGEPASPATAPAAAPPASGNPLRDRATGPASAAPPAAHAPVFWRGSSVFLSFSANLNTFAPALQLTQNSTVDASLAFRPRVYIARDWQLRGGFNLLYEFTNSDTTTTMHELRASDTFVDLWFHGIPALRWFRFWVAARVTLPTSLESQMRTMVAAPSLLTQASFTVDRVAGGVFAVIANASYQHPFYLYNTGGVVGRYAYPRPCLGAATDACTQQLSGVANVSDSITWSVVAAQDWGWISPGVFFSMTHAHAYEFDWASAYRAAGLQPPSNTSFPSWRQYSTFAFWVDLTPTSWLTFEVGYSMTRNVLDANGQYGNPFFAQYQDMRAYVQTVFTPDRLYEQLTRRAVAGHGVLRVRNDRTPPSVNRAGFF